ncbi:CHC2 zinc finger domain-containing protein [Thiomonas sp.]
MIAARRPVQARLFDRSRLPDPLTFYPAELGALHGRGVWRSALCPFHKDSRPSLRVNVQTGAFRCMVCGASGGDVLAFQMQRYGLPFAAAAKAVGAWNEGHHV